MLSYDFLERFLIDLVLLTLPIVLESTSVGSLGNLFFVSPKLPCLWMYMFWNFAWINLIWASFNENDFLLIRFFIKIWKYVRHDFFEYKLQLYLNFEPMKNGDVQPSFWPRFWHKNRRLERVWKMEQNEEELSGDLRCYFVLCTCPCYVTLWGVSSTASALPFFMFDYGLWFSPKIPDHSHLSGAQKWDIWKQDVLNLP